MDRTIIYEDNIACISHLKERYIKGDKINLFFTLGLQKNGDISLQQIRLCDNLADIFTKSLSNRIFEHLIQKIGLCASQR